MTDFDLNVLIDRALAGKEPDPHVIARRLLPKVPQGERDALLASLLVERVTFRLRMARSGHLADDLARGQRSSDAHTTLASGDLTADHNSTEARSSHVGGTSRWQKHYRTIRDRQRLAAGWKFTKDLTAEECEEVAVGYERRAAQNQTLANYFRTLAFAIRETGVGTVGELQEPPSAERAA